MVEGPRHNQPRTRAWEFTSGVRFGTASFRIKGKTYIQSARTTNKTLAKEYDRKFKNDVYNREYLGERESIALVDALDQYLKTKKDTKNYVGLVSNVRTVKTYFDETLKLHDLTTALVESL
jgi:hypothetical protein